MAAVTYIAAPPDHFAGGGVSLHRATSPTRLRSYNWSYIGLAVANENWQNLYGIQVDAVAKSPLGCAILSLVSLILTA